MGAIIQCLPSLSSIETDTKGAKNYKTFLHIKKMFRANKSAKMLSCVVMVFKRRGKKHHRYAARIEEQIKSRKKRAQLNLALVKIREKCSNDRRLPTLGGVAATAMHLARCKMNKNFASFFFGPFANRIESGDKAHQE